MLFIYYGFYDIGWTPLPCSSIPEQLLRDIRLVVLFTNVSCAVAYGAEILPYHMRLKGLGIMLSVQSIAQAFVSSRSKSPDRYYELHANRILFTEPVG